jgi:microcystin-dependent protein
MAESYSTSLKITLIGDGDLAGTWGDTTNTNWNLIEQAVTGVDYLSSMGDSNYTLSNLNGTSDESRNQVIVIPSTTTLSATRYVYAPYVNKTYIISNQSSGGQAIYIQGIVSGTPTGSPLLIQNGVTTEVYCDGINGFFSGATGSTGNFNVNGNLTVNGATNIIPAGVIQMWPTSSPPTGFLICNGGSYSTSTYANLFAAIGYTFGGSSGTFLVPDYRDCMPIGAGGTIAASIGATGGSSTTTLSGSNLPAHTHSFSGSGSGSTNNASASIQDPGHFHTISNQSADQSGSGKVTVGSSAPEGTNPYTDSAKTGIYDSGHAHGFSVSISGTTGSTGSGTAATTISPYLGINFIIKT